MASRRLLDERQDHTEASVKLAEICDPDSPAACICEIIKDDGEMLTVKNFDVWNKDKNLNIGHIGHIGDIKNW
jgi:3,4-dihydroxy-2-butanone 4-phosphate synthase